MEPFIVGINISTVRLGHVEKLLSMAGNLCERIDAHLLVWNDDPNGDYEDFFYYFGEGGDGDIVPLLVWKKDTERPSTDEILMMLHRGDFPIYHQ